MSDEKKPAIRANEMVERNVAWVPGVQPNLGVTVSIGGRLYKPSEIRQWQGPDDSLILILRLATRDLTDETCPRTGEA